MSVPERPTVQAHREVAAVLRAGELAVDATAGNGHDTLFLAERVGPTGRVLAFDIQPAAIEATRARLAAAGLAERVGLVLGSHGDLAEHVAPGGVAAVMFNLGYFPGGDHAVITRTAETLRALGAAAAALRPGGIVTVVCYPGHPGGEEESAAVVAWAEALDRGSFAVEVQRRGGTLKPAPFLVKAARRCGDA
jgi:predicted methyltransferase